MKIVICNGGYKTGSTLSFNIVLSVLKNLGVKHKSHGLRARRTANLVYKDELNCWHVVKSHHYLPKEDLPHVKVIHTYRNPLSVWASTSVPGIIDGSDEDKTCRQFEKLMWQRADYEYHLSRDYTLLLPYLGLYNDLDGSIRQVCEFIEVDVDKVDVESIARDLAPESMKRKCEKIKTMDGHTQLRNHTLSERLGNPDGWKKVLSPALIEEITRVIGIWTE